MAEFWKGVATGVVGSWVLGQVVVLYFLKEIKQQMESPNGRNGKQTRQ